MVSGIRKWLVCLAGLAFLSGCVGMLPSPFRPSPGPQKSPQINDLAEAFDIVCRNYKIGPGDALNVLYQAEWSIPPGSYRLQTLDKIRVKFLFDPELNEEVTIAPDGVITLQGVGEMQAAGLTRQELADRIEQRLIESKIFTPERLGGAMPGYRMVTVHLLEFYGRLNKLLDALRGLSGGTQQGLTVKPDGTLDMPLLSESVLCAGYTVKEVEATINRLYRRGVFQHIYASVSLAKSNSRQYFVMGESGAGSYPIDQPITVLQAIAKAGGYNAETADITSVMLISRDINGKPIGRRLDLKKILDVGDMSSSILVKPNDLIYIPRTYISDVHTFMNQYVSLVSTVNSLVRSLGAQ